MKLKYLSGLLLLAAGLSVASCSDDDDYSIATGNIISQVTTGDASSITAVSAVVTGTVVDLTQSSSSSYTVGAVYGTAANPTASGTRQAGAIDESGTVTTTLSGLTGGTTYYYATFVTLQGKVTTYGEVKSFVATDATVATVAATDISATKATLGGQFEGTTGLDETTLTTGVKLAATAEGVTTGVAYPVGQVSGLLPGTTYYYAAYAIVGGAEEYGDAQSFTTEAQEMQYVDLGLSMLWAECNLGAESASEAGALMGYGDATGLLRSSDNADYPGTAVSGTDNDAAATVDGLTPTAANFAELLANTTQSRETVDGVEGIRFTAANGNSIFLPVTGYRDGTETTAGNGYYWTGDVDATNSDYGASVSFTTGDATAGYSQRALGFAIRPVQASNTVSVDNSLLALGDLENEGNNYRIEIYNEYGGTASNPPIDPASIVFNSQMDITFTISGLNGAAATNAYTAQLMCTALGWWPQVQEGEGMVTVQGDGTYTLTYTPSAGAYTNGVIVFCIDIQGMARDLDDIDAVSVTIDAINLN